MSTSTTTMLDIGRKAGHAEAVSMMRAVVRETQRIGPGFDLQAECIVRIVEHALAEGWDPDHVVGTLEKLPYEITYVRGVQSNTVGGQRWGFYANRQALETARDFARIKRTHDQYSTTPARRW